MTKDEMTDDERTLNKMMQVTLDEINVNEIKCL
jgi:hypothetical protein